MSDRVQGRPRRVRPATIRTLADLAERNHLYAHCNHCRHARKLDVPVLLARFGPLTFGRLKNRLRCARCGARRPEVMHVWDNGAL
jgi:hypothetical protein